MRWVKGSKNPSWETLLCESTPLHEKPSKLTHHRVSQDIFGPDEHVYYTGPQGDTITCKGCYWPGETGMVNPGFESCPLEV